MIKDYAKQAESFFKDINCNKTYVVEEEASNSSIFKKFHDKSYKTVYFRDMKNTFFYPEKVEATGRQLTAQIQSLSKTIENGLEMKWRFQNIINQIQQKPIISYQNKNLINYLKGTIGAIDNTILDSNIMNYRDYLHNKLLQLTQPYDEDRKKMPSLRFE